MEKLIGKLEKRREELLAELRDELVDLDSSIDVDDALNISDYSVDTELGDDTKWANIIIGKILMVDEMLYFCKLNS